MNTASDLLSNLVTNSFSLISKVLITIYKLLNWTYAISFFYSPTQLSQRLQCEARGGRKILQVKQYFNFTVCPLMITSFVLGGGRYPPELEPFAISKHGNRTHYIFHMSFGVCTELSLMATYSKFQIDIKTLKTTLFPICILLK